MFDDPLIWDICKMIGRLFYTVLVKLRLIVPFAYACILSFVFPEFERAHPALAMAIFIVIMIFVVASWAVTFWQWIQKTRGLNKGEAGYTMKITNRIRTKGNVENKITAVNGQKNDSAEQ